MRRVATGSQTATLGTPNAEIGTPGFFNQAAPGAGVVPTIPGPDWFNTMQEEMVALATASGAALDASGGVNNQALTALLQVTTLQVSGYGYGVPGSFTYTVPAGKTQIYVEVWGAGGGGGGSAATAGAVGGGGGGGAYARALLTGLTPGQQIAVVVGQGGAGGVGGSGANGTASSVGADISCGGGLGGGYASSTTPGAYGGGGTPTVSGSPPFNVAFSGSAGGLGGPISTTGAVVFAQGGASFGFVGTAIGIGGDTATTAGAAPFPAGGGGGGANGGNGGNGGNGLVIIRC